MKWSFLIAVLGLASTLFAPPSDRSYTAAHHVLILDGKQVGFLRSCSGGEPFAEALPQGGGADRIARKVAGPPRYAPIIIEVGLDADQAVWTWVSELLAGKPSYKSGGIQTADANYRVIEELRFKDALLSEVVFPAFDASAGKATGDFTLKLIPSTTQYVVPSGEQKISGNLGAKQKRWTPSNFRLEIDGLDCGRVMKIENLAVLGKVVEEASGRVREPQKNFSKLELPNLNITLSATNSESFRQWADGIVTGKHDEFNGVIVMLDPSMKEELGRVELKGLGILRLARSPLEPGGDKTARLTATVYVEEIGLKLGGAGATETTPPPKTTEPAPKPPVRVPPRPRG